MRESHSAVLGELHHLRMRQTGRSLTESRSLVNLKPLWVPDEPGDRQNAGGALVPVRSAEEERFEDQGRAG